MLTGPIRYASETLSALKQRIGHYIQLAACYTEDWGIFDEDGTPRLFRCDVKTLTDMVIRAEHFLRCAIILTVFEKLRTGVITPRRFTLPLVPDARARKPEAPLHHLAELRGISKRDPAPPRFSVTLPKPSTAQSARRSDTVRTSSHGRRPRNDDVLAVDILLKRVDRLKDLRADLETRAETLAAIWAGMLISRRRVARTSKIPTPTAFLPLPDWRPPPETTQGAPPDETEDLVSLHWAAYNAAEGIAALCGRMR